MLIKYLQRILTGKATKLTSHNAIFWFSLSLTFVAIYALLAMQQAFNGEYIVQDDARQHVFWMQRFVDPDLFPNDWIADYFQSIEPLGTATLYRLMASIGIQPILLSKLLPIIVGLITTGYCFAVCMEILPVPFAAFTATLLLNQNLWMQDTLTSGTSKIFLHPLFLAFLYYLLRRSLLACLIAIALQALFYPTFIFISAGILVLRILNFENGKIGLSKNRSDYIFCISGLAISGLMLSPYAFSSSEFGPTVTLAEARAMPEFLPEGRTTFFNDDNPLLFWFDASRSGIRLRLSPPFICAGLLLPILWRYQSKFPLCKQVNSGVMVSPQIAIVSLFLFFAAHALLFKLYLPSRYTQHSLRIAIAIAAGIALTAMLDALFHALERQTKISLYSRNLLALVIVIILGVILIFYPISLKKFPWTGYIVGEAPPIYEFFQKQPKDILIASLAGEVDNIPTFSQRSILVGKEYALPYHVGYYRKIRQRIADLIRAQYSESLLEVKNFIQEYGIDFWMVDKVAFTPHYVAKDRWFRQYQPATSEALATLKKKAKPALAGAIAPCSVFETQYVVIMEAKCILKLQK